MKFQLIETKCQNLNTFLAFKLSGIIFIMLKDVKMPTLVGILTLISMKNEIYNLRTRYDYIQLVQLQRHARKLKFCNNQVKLLFFIESQ